MYALYTAVVRKQHSQIKNLKQEIENFIAEVNRVKGSVTLKKDYLDLRTKLKSLELDNSEEFSKLTDQLQGLRDFKSFDELPKSEQLIAKASAAKFRIDYFEDWNNRGKYLFDLDSIITKLDSILFRLNQKH